MRFLLIVLIMVLAMSGLDILCVALMTPAAIRAEYWVGELMVVKREIVRSYHGQRKILFVSGSSSMFDIDTLALTRNLGLPVLNLGLHMSLPLSEILSMGSDAAESGDVVILPLKPHYFCEGGLTTWQIRNQIAWDRDRWIALGPLDKLKAAGKAGPMLPLEIALARTEQAFAPESLSKRLRALDARETVTRFHASLPPRSFSYSAYNVDALGNMLGTESTGPFRGVAQSASATSGLCRSSRALLKQFTIQLQARGVRVFFAGTPYVEDGRVDAAVIDAADEGLASQLTDIAPVLERRTSLVFDRRFFLDTDLHLNAEGRVKRTRLLLKALRDERILG